MVISFITEQGGVGKTSLCYNLAWYIASSGKKVLMIDLDPQGGNLSFMMGVPNRDNQMGIYEYMEEKIDSIKEAILKIKENLYIIPANESCIDLHKLLSNEQNGEYVIKAIIDQVKDDYDYVFIDLNPTPSMTHVSSLVASDKMIIPAMVDGKTIEATKHVLDTYKAVKESYNPELEVLAVVYNMYSVRRNLGKAVEAELKGYCNALKINIANAKIPNTVEIAETSLAHIGVTEYAKSSKGSKAFKELVSELFGISE